MKAMFDMDRISLEEYRNYLNDRMAAYDEFSVAYMDKWEDIQALNKKEADEREKQAEAQRKSDEAEKKRIDDLREAEKKRYEDLAKATAERERQAQAAAEREKDRLAMIEAARVAAEAGGPVTIYANGTTPESVMAAIDAYERNNGTRWRS